ncbi:MULTISPECIES: restriction endonuclease subunit S [Pseudomonas]|uniref:restriction endonuclease subunit S n=1 Tax=Pseudomonas TaxID=286 RepID=UPI0002D7920D|nr:MULTISPECIES: restriction endonuclease subunit S [Pseudomonas]MDC7830984.1 restriction endonuclease subunit S [Pseudomonas benzopyrenica]
MSEKLQSLDVAIPDKAGWPKKTLDELCSLISRGTAPVYVESSSVLAIGQRCVTTSRFAPEFARPHAERAIRNVLRPESGDVLLNSTGTGTIGRSVVFDHDGAFIVDGHVTVLRPKPEGADGRWLNALLRTSWGQRHLERFCYAGSTNQLELSRTPVTASMLPVPSLAEQHAIAQVLDTLDTAIRETEALIDKLKAVKQGLLHDLLTRGIDTNGQLRPLQSEAPQLYRESPLGWIPREWELRELGKLAEISRGKFTHRPRNDPAFFGGEYPFIQTGDVALAQGGYIYSYSQTLSKRGISVSQEFPAGTIAITIAANIADTAILACPMFFPDSIVGAVVAPEYNIRFVELSIRRAKRTLDTRAPQSAQKNINLQDLRPLLLAVPGRIEQDAIAARYDAIQAQLEAEQIAVNKLCQKKFGLMDDLLTGRVCVTPLLESIQQAATPTGA